jgi:hypothetical protein
MARARDDQRIRLPDPETGVQQVELNWATDQTLRDVLKILSDDSITNKSNKKLLETMVQIQGSLVKAQGATQNVINSEKRKVDELLKEVKEQIKQDAENASKIQERLDDVVDSMDDNTQSNEDIVDAINDSSRVQGKRDEANRRVLDAIEDSVRDDIRSTMLTFEQQNRLISDLSRSITEESQEDSSPAEAIDKLAEILRRYDLSALEKFKVMLRAQEAVIMQNIKNSKIIEMPQLLLTRLIDL